jgi:hypothetical protein
LKQVARTEKLACRIMLERFQAKWAPVRVKKTRQNKKIERDSESIQTESDLKRESQLIGLDVRLDRAVRAAGAARLGAGTKRVIHDLLDRPRAAATLGATAQTTVNIPRRARQFARSRNHGRTNVVVGQDIARTHNHEQTIIKDRLIRWWC